MEYEIKRINVWSIIKIVFIISFLIGVLIGIFYALILTTIGNLIQDFVVNEYDFAAKPINTFSVFFLILFCAVIVSISNSILSAIFIICYNVVVQWIGGVKVELNLTTDLES